jgi:elongation factor P hydroxylase
VVSHELQKGIDQGLGSAMFGAGFYGSALKEHHRWLVAARGMEADVDAVDP